MAEKETKKTKKQPKKQETRKSPMQVLREKDNAVLEKEIAGFKKELFELRFQSAVGKLKDSSRLAKCRKEIARRLTIITERANAEAK